MTGHFDVFDRDGCYFCRGDIYDGSETICRSCRAVGHTEREAAAKRLIASILRDNRENK